MRILIAIICTILLIGCTHSGGAEEENTTFIYPPWKHTWGVVRATPLKLRLFVGDKTHFNDPQGIACARLKSWDDTTDTYDDDEITAYGVNSGDNCIIYNSSMFSLGIYGLEKGQREFNKPWGIAADSKGNVYVTDRGNSRVVRLFNPGKQLQFVSNIGSAGHEPGEFIDPRGIALDPGGNVYITDAALDRITVLSDSGSVIFIKDGFIEPFAIAVIGENEEWTYNPNETFIVVLDSTQRIRKLSLKGDIIAETRAVDWGISNAQLNWIALDYYNQLLITDRNNGCIHKLDSDLDYLTSFGKSGNGDYQFDEPRGISIYRRFGQIIVAERLGAQYLWVAVDVSGFRAFVKTDSIWRDLAIDFFLTEPAFCKFDVLDKYGRFITRITQSRRLKSGENHLEWDLRVPLNQPDDQRNNLPDEYIPGQLLPSGEYTIQAEFRATYSSRKHWERKLETKFRLSR